MMTDLKLNLIVFLILGVVGVIESIYQYVEKGNIDV